jgi:pyruvate dehydrogenase E2 component (dihydrolipoamide acetyltransferase)/2-oxoglutarate dehydrogenase E2 component (dihydrolipoamide succinyltransferase)
MPLDVIMPALGMAQETGRIVDWHKQPGDPVALGDILFEVETDKATMEVEAAGDGFLTDVSALVGTDVPVGTVIARISDSAESSSPSPQIAATPDDAAPAPDDGDSDLPDGHAVIMPTLGMAQDTGLLVAWRKAPGDKVVEDEILFEVETDKSTVEVNAGADGYLAAVLAAEGDNVPVGQTIAIISAKSPKTPIIRAAASPAAATQSTMATPPTAKSKTTPTASVASKSGTDHPEPVPANHGRILASPKARRLAREQGLDLGRLVAAGHPQPFHANDIKALKALSSPLAPQVDHAPARAANRLTAQIATEGFTDFAIWAAKDAYLTDANALLAGFCAASLGQKVVVLVEGFSAPTAYTASLELGLTKATEDAPALRLCDLRFTPITTVQMGADDTPVITMTRFGDGLTLTLEYTGDQLTAEAAISLLSNFAGRMEQPLRHLL